LFLEGVGTAGPLDFIAHAMIVVDASALIAILERAGDQKVGTRS
jgi:hypothetical protein